MLSNDQRIGDAGAARALNLSFLAGAVGLSNASGITIPADAHPFTDIAVLFDAARTSGANGSPPKQPPSGPPAIPDVTPPGFTNLQPSLTGESGGGGAATRRLRVTGSYKILLPGDPNTSVTGIGTGTIQKVMLVYRASQPIRDVAVTAFGPVGQEISTGNVAAQSISVGIGVAALMLSAVFATGGGAFDTASPAFDFTQAGPNGELLVGSKLYRAEPAGQTVDIADLGAIQGLISSMLLIR